MYEDEVRRRPGIAEDSGGLRRKRSLKQGKAADFELPLLEYPGQKKKADGIRLTFHGCPIY